jgi:CHAD domain-containing protein
MADGKWISDLSELTPVVDAARRVLAVRLEVVRDALPLARFHSEDDPEHVHQLRVGTRRAGAALDIFRLCLPAKVYRQARKRLKSIRRAAGHARDWDVFTLTLAVRAQQSAAKDRPGLDVLTGFAFGQRQAAQGELEQVSPDPPFAFERLMADTLAALGDPDPDLHVECLLDLARPLLNGLLQELNEAAGRDLEDYGHLHRVRIIGKRLRYAMEVFTCCFVDEFRERYYVAVEEMQEILGRANDSHTAQQRLSWLRDRLRSLGGTEWKRVQPGLAALLRYHQRNLPAQRRHFLKWWGRWQKMDAETAFAGLLKSMSAAAS